MVRCLRRFLFIFSIAFVILGCGDEGTTFDTTVPTQTYPYVSRLNPAAGTAGDSITIFGIGFSFVAQYNIVSLGAIAVTADTYALIDPVTTAYEIEQLTFTIPSNATAGDVNIVVTVLGAPSNSNITLTINP